jgi:hypothetical protein
MNVSLSQASGPARLAPDPLRMQQLDHGVRSNDSVFSTLPEAATLRGPRAVSAAAPAASDASRVDEQVLPFTVGVVQSEAQLAAVQALRACAYEHHLPGMGDTFGGADAMDRRAGSVVFYVRDKKTGELVGSAR